MSLATSRPFEELISASDTPHRVHTLIVGSGYGAAFAALALALREDKPYGNEEILVLERGNEYLPGDFPKTASDLPAHLSVQANDSERTGYADALFDVRVGEHVMAIVGSGLGGTSLINAGVAIDPTPEVFSRWPAPPDGGTWAALLAPSLRFVREVLGVRAHPRGDALLKVQALKRLAKALGKHASHALADIAVSFDAGPNTVGVEQAACTDCGNCFTGCNVGAKNTLAMNAWPLARASGVDIVTGGSALDVRPAPVGSDFAWIVQAQGTSAPGKLLIIEAQRVILAAGTFGSTEILHRSRANLGLNSKPLGGGFSLNGDGISFGFGQRAPVRAYASVPSSPSIQPEPDERPGPTIVSVASVTQQGVRGLLEDATVPQAIARLWGEILSTQAMMRGYVSDVPSAWHTAHPQADPLSVSAHLMQHHQVVLTMGVDDAKGMLSFDNDRLRLAWPKDEDDAPQWMHRQLDAARLLGGFDGGLHFDNPFWKPLPEDFDAVFEGASRFGGTHLCNHPLGGCAMGASGKTGVVDPEGRVFGTDGVPLAGLYVLDGAILPGALGINPFMTIAALAHGLARRMDGPPAAAQIRVPSMLPPRRLPTKQGRQVDWPLPPLAFEFSERLFGPLNADDARRIGTLLGQATDVHGVVIDAVVQLPEIYAWLEAPEVKLSADFKLYVDSEPSGTIDTVRDAHLGAPVGTGRGWVQWLVPAAREAWYESRKRCAIERFLALRGDEVWRSAKGGGLDAFLRVAKQHTLWRELRYDFTLQINDRAIAVTGTKRLAYASGRRWDSVDEANPWTTLTRITLAFADNAAGKRAQGEFRVDVVRMADHLQPLQHTGSAETPQVAVAVACAAAFFVRVMTQTHLWSFAAPTYTDFPTCDEAEKDRKHLVTEIVYWWERQKYSFRVDVAVQTARWRLLRAKPAEPGKHSAPVLLIHGLAHSSRVFCTETVDRNLAGYLLYAGHEVWLLDHGLSTALDDVAHPSIDDIAEQVAEAIRYVHDETDQRVDVFSHCVGSAALSMAVLGGRLLLPDETSLIRSLVMHAVPPWIQPSESNLLRAYAGAFFKDRFFPDRFDPVPYKPGTGPDISAGDLVLDRFAFSLPWSKQDYAPHNHRDKYGQFGRTICNRMTALYGYEWSHRNLDPRTHPLLGSLVGPADANAYRQLYFLLNRKRVTDSQGANVFVRVDKFEENWKFPTLFLHGSDNQVFHVESSRLAAHQLAAIQDKRYTVDLRVIDGYGHMDLLFGVTAWDQVFGHVLDFFQHGGRDVRKEAPVTPTKASTSVATGPTISRPMVVDGRHVLRVWAESDEFQASAVKRIDFLHDGHALPASTVFARPLDQSVNALKASSFWLYDVECDGVKGAVTPSVVSGSPGIKLFGLQNGGAMQWAGLPWFERFRADAPDNQLAFVVGSCRYPGSWFDTQVSDRIYASIRKLVTEGRGIDHLLLVGDQIYADATNALFDIREHRERYQESYRRAFNSERQAWVQAHLPTYMAVDDHEFTNNYKAVSILGGRLGTAPSQPLGVAAAQEAWNFQMHHGYEPSANTNRLWYWFSSAGFEFFVFDTRSERRPPTGLKSVSSEAQRDGFRHWLQQVKSEPRPIEQRPMVGLESIISDAQRDGFRNWLQQVKSGSRPIFIVTGSPLAPLPVDEVNHPARAQISDSLRAYPTFVAWLASEIDAADVQSPVVLLSGDPHLSAMCEVEIRTSSQNSPCRMLCIVASGIHVPLPFANDAADDYVWGPSQFVPPGAGIEVHVTSAQLLSVHRDHALRVEVLRESIDRWTLVVTVVLADGGMTRFPPMNLAGAAAS